MAQAILLTGQERRRRWSSDDRLEILEAAFAPAANVSEVARRFDVSTGLLFTWRRQALSVKVGAAFVPATVLGVPGSGDGGAATIVVDFANGTKVRVASWAPCDFAAAVMRALNDPDQFERARLDCERPLRYAQGDAGSCSDCRKVWVAILSNGSLYVFRAKRAQRPTFCIRFRFATIAYPWHPLFGSKVRVSPYRRGKSLMSIYTDKRPDLSHELPNWMFDERGGSVCLNSFGRFAKWISASIMPPPSLGSAR